MYRSASIAITLFSIMILSLFTPSPITRTVSSNRDDGPEDSTPVTMPEPGGVVHYIKDGRMICREATQDEALIMIESARDQALQEIHGEAGEISSQGAGLKIILRATQQLNNYPEAKQAFLRAAATWESLIENPITIVVDVDFGPTRFGKPYSEDELGSTGFQNFVGFSLYPSVREKLIEDASSPQERSFYNSLPASAVPTELGDTTNIFGPATLFRALGILDAVADPEQERERLGSPPSIGFNSANKFDFDSRDGVAGDAIDFDGLALHEIGHVLGFFSMAGNREQFPTAPVGISPWDLFRFRPGITAGSFPFSPRVLVSGGRHIFFTGDSAIELSTGRQDKIGGDGQQSHHWKDNELSGIYLGIMDPTFNYGEHATITENDLAALDTMGYKIARGGDEPIINTLAASLDGDVLTLTVNATDSQGDIATAQVKLFDGAGQLVAQTAPFTVNVGTSTEVNFYLTITNLSSFPTAVQASLTLTDRQDQTSQPLMVDFRYGDPGGPLLSSAFFSGSRLKIKGKGLGGILEIEINGRIVASGVNVANKKVIVKGGASVLNLQSGPNRIRIRKGQLWSNIFTAIL